MLKVRLTAEFGTKVATKALKDITDAARGLETFEEIIKEIKDVVKNKGRVFFQYFLKTININGIVSITIYNPLCLSSIVNNATNTYKTIFFFFFQNSSVLNINSLLSIINIGIIPEKNISFHIVIL